MPDKINIPKDKYSYEIGKAENISKELQDKCGKKEGMVILKKSFNPHYKVEAINVKDNDFVGHIVSKLKEKGITEKEMKSAFND